MYWEAHLIQAYTWPSSNWPAGSSSFPLLRIALSATKPVHTKFCFQMIRSQVPLSELTASLQVQPWWTQHFLSAHLSLFRLQIGTAALRNILQAWSPIERIHVSWANNTWKRLSLMFAWKRSPITSVQNWNPSRAKHSRSAGRLRFGLASNDHPAFLWGAAATWLL